MFVNDSVSPRGELSLRVLRAPRTYAGERFSLLRSVLAGLPSFKQPAEVNLWRLRNLPNLLQGTLSILLGMLFRSQKNRGTLYLRVFKADGRVLDLGVVSHQLITTAGVNALVAGMNASDATTFQNFKFHGIGTGTTAPAVGNTALETEITTAYQTDNVRPTGSQTVGGSNNIYRTVGTVTVDASVANTEYGLLSDADVGQGTLLDRFTYTVVNLANGDSVQGTIDITLPAGS